MKTIFKPLIMIMPLAWALAACSQADEPAADAEPAPTASASASAAPAAAANGENRPTREPPLLEGKLDGIRTAEGGAVDSVMYVASFPPGSASTHHEHPGWEYNYILEGEVTFEVAGQEPFTRKAGEGMYNPKGNSHTVRNASQTEPAKLVSILIKDEGAPVAVDVPAAETAAN